MIITCNNFEIECSSDQEQEWKDSETSYDDVKFVVLEEDHYWLIKIISVISNIFGVNTIGG